MVPPLKRAMEEVCRGALSIDGWVRKEELQFLFQAAALPTTQGEVLEIGSFRGRSAVVLAKAAKMAGQDRVFACDPFPPRPAADPSAEDTTYDDFIATLRDHKVTENVEVHRIASSELARIWDRPIRLLWIDGDHTYAGVKGDVDGFLSHLAPGAIIALHDVDHPDWPACGMCFLEDVLLSDRFGMCGICHSIGWAQFVGADGRRDHKQIKMTTYQLLGARRLRKILRVKLPVFTRWRERRFRKGSTFQEWISSTQASKAER